jgi:hypothetical protein
VAKNIGKIIIAPLPRQKNVENIENILAQNAVIFSHKNECSGNEYVSG